MVRWSMALLMGLLAVALITPNSALAAKMDTGTSYRAKVFASDGVNSVSAIFTCSSSGSLSGSFFYTYTNLVSGLLVSSYGDYMTPATCPSINQLANGNGTWSTATKTGVITPVTATVTVESIQGKGAMGTIALQFQFAPGGHTFTSTNTSCGADTSVANPCVKLTLKTFSDTSIPDFNGGTSATLLLSVRG
jgi:hypothetical protein